MRKKLLIQGMHCASCAINIEKALKKVKGVNEVNISALTNKAFVDCNEKVSDEEMKKAVASAGYKVATIDNL